MCHDGRLSCQNVGGDFGAALDALELVREAISGAVYAIFGSYDSIRMVPQMEKMRIQILINESVILERNSQSIYLSGIRPMKPDCHPMGY